MTTPAWITLALLVAMFVLLVWNKLPIWLVFIGTLTVAMTLQLASPASLLKGYSNTGVITVAALYPVAAGMYATGAISLLSDRIIGLPKSVTVAQLRIFVPISIVSAFLYNTPLVAMMIPAVRDLTRRTGLSGSKLFMGLSYIALLGGTITLIGTATNLIIAGLVSDAVAKGELPVTPIGLFDPAWIGIPATVAGLAYMILIGSPLLKDQTGSQAGSCGGAYVFRCGVVVNQPWSQLFSVCNDPDECCLVRIHQSGRVPNQFDGPKTRWLRFF